MEETLIFPSPNWFQAAGLMVSSDGWVVYGGPSKSLCVLEPYRRNSETRDEGNLAYQAHVYNRAHPEKIVCVDICPEWPLRRYVLTGSFDGSVKQWSLEDRVRRTIKMKSTHSHELHHKEKEEVAGVGYCKDGFAVTVGCYGHIVKWDLNSNVAKTFNHILKNFRPVCMACSPHIHLNVAVGTKQGIVFLLDLNGAGQILYKVRGHDDEIMKISWCPQFEVTVKKSLHEKKSVATIRMEKIRQQPESSEMMKILDERVTKATKDMGKEHNDSGQLDNGTEISAQFAKENKRLEEPSVLKEPLEEPAEGKPAEEKFAEEKPAKEKPAVENPAEGESVEGKIIEEQLLNRKSAELKPAEESAGGKPTEEKPVEGKASEGKLTEGEPAEEKHSDGKPSEGKPAEGNETLDESGIGKTLPEDSFDESAVVPEDDMFDIYKDHEVDEFGHKKYKPVDILVTDTEETKKDDYLADCMKLKEDILKLKNLPDSTIEDLVEALDKTHMVVAGSSKSSETCGLEEVASKNTVEDSSSHIHKHLLASIGKQGSVRIWSKSGKLVGTCAVPNSGGKNQKLQKHNINWTTLLWYKAGILLIADGKSQLLECNPLQIDCKNKLEWRIVHTLHKRGMYCIASNAPRVQSPDLSADDSHDDHWAVWSVSQDRSLIHYSLKKREVVTVHNSCGGFLYYIDTCPYDARRVAISVGDGAVRLLEMDTSGSEDSKLSSKQVASYWQNVQGKVLTVAWHPTRENLLAFSTAEARVGLIDTNSKNEKPAKVLASAFSGGVYSISWGDQNDLYACASGELVVYKANKPEDEPTPMPVELEGQKWAVSSVRWYPHAFVIGNDTGAVAVLTPTQPHEVVSAIFLFEKMIHTTDWHPQATSTSSDESPHKNLIAVCSVDKANTIIIVEYGDKDGLGTKLSKWKTLSGHMNTVLQVAWNPHVDGQLLSTSQDKCVRIWDVVAGVTTSIFDGHVHSALSAVWCAFPQAATKVLSGGGDCCLRLWDIADYPAADYSQDAGQKKKEKKKRDRKRKDDKKKEDEDANITEEQHEQGEGATVLQTKAKPSRKFLFPTLYKQTNPCKVNGLRIMLEKYLAKMSGDNGQEINAAKDVYDVDFLKIFGNINELNEILNDEMERHEDTGLLDSWMIICIFRGNIDTMIQYASARDLLDPFLVSISPCVSFKFWKDTTQLYLAQIDRVIAKGNEADLNESKHYGGAVFRKVASLLSLHDVRGAVTTLTEARLFLEAYILCKMRYMESIGGEILQLWAFDCIINGNLNMAAICYIAIGDLSQAATILGRSSCEESLSFAAELAKVIGQKTYADHIEVKRDRIISTKETSQTETKELVELPSRAEILLKDDGDEKDQRVSDKEASDKDKTEEMLEELPSKMEALMSDMVGNGSGDAGIVVQNGDKCENRGQEVVVPDIGVQETGDRQNGDTQNSDTPVNGVSAIQE